MNNDDIWKCLNFYFEKHGLVSHKIDSYENFVENVTDLVKGHDGRFTIRVTRSYRGQETEDVNIETAYQFAITRCFLTRRNIYSDRYEEEIYPMSARLRDLTYTRQLKIDIEVTLIQKDKRDQSRKEIFK